MSGEPLYDARVHALGAASKSVSETVARDEAARVLLASEGPMPSAEDYRALALSAVESGGPDELRRERRRRLSEIAARDVNGELSLDEVGRSLAHLADACLEAGLLAADAPPDLAVVGMGKLGGLELNYSSDVDVIFVVDAEVESATRS